MTRLLALLANDDGYGSLGIQTLFSALRERMDVVLCAPDNEQSTTSHSLSLNRPLRLRQHSQTVFSVDGTPADCVYVALTAIGRVLSRRPDIVVSGINHGVNLGDDVFYSGTVAAAREAALKGIPAVAASAAAGASFEAAAQVVARLVERTAAEKRPLLYNVNFPPGDRWVLRATRLGRRIYEESVEFRRDPREREYLWIGGAGVTHRPLAGADTEAFDQGVVGITPLVLDLWSRGEQERVEALTEDVESATTA